MSVSVSFPKLVFLLPAILLSLLACVTHVSSLHLQPRSQSVNREHGALFEKCDRVNKKMVMRAVNVTLSKLLNSEGHLWCKHAQTLEIFALESLILDRDLIVGANGLGTVIMVAKDWVVVGSRKIDLTGRQGRQMPQRAADGDEKHPNGRDGAPGYPGEPGGNFYGLYETLLGIDSYSSLTIISNGGNGSTGQNGGNGRTGHSGDDGKYENFPSPYSELDSKMERLRNLEFNALYTYRYKNYVLHGKRGSPGGHGGNGGVGGLGGNPGFVKISSVTGGSIPVEIVRAKGKNGGSGVGGHGGPGGKHGDGYQCTWRGVLGDSIRWWDKCHYVPSSKTAEGLFATSGRAGKNGGNNIGLQQPVNPSKNFADQDFARARENFQQFVTANSNL